MHELTNSSNSDFYSEKHTVITSKAQLRDWLKHEKQRYRAKDGILYILQCRENEILYRHARMLRYAEYYKNTSRFLLAKLSQFLLLRFQNRYSIHVPLNTCGKGFKIMHLGPVLINGNAILGQNCTLHINSSIVAGGTNDGVPKLGNNVVVGVGAVVLGPVYIADYVAIGANAVVNRDVSEEHITVAGVPAVKVSNHGTESWNTKNKSAPPTVLIESSVIAPP